MFNKNPLIQIDNLLLKLNEEQLRELNRKIVERLKLIHRAKSAVSMAKFNLNDRVFLVHDNKKLIGTVIRLNPRSVTVNMDDGRQWRIAPEFLTKIIEQ